MNQILVFFLIVLAIIASVLIPIIVLKKIKYYKILGHKEYYGIIDLFNFFSKEWVIASLTFGFPILGKDNNPVLNSIRKEANRKVFLFYGVIILLLTTVIILGQLEN